MVSLLLAETNLTTPETSWILWTGLATLSVTIALRVAWAGRSGDGKLKSLWKKSWSMAWIAPAMAIIAVVAMQASSRLTPIVASDSANDPTAADSADAGLAVEGHDWTARWIANAERVLEPVASGPWSTPAEARRDALEKATRRLKQDFERVHGHGGRWELPVEIVERSAIRKQTTTTQSHKLSVLASNSEMHYCVVQLELSNKTRNLAKPYWREQIGGDRLVAMGVVIGLACLLIVTTHIYMRLDLASGGSHRGKLQVAATSLMAAAGIAAATVLSA